VITPNPEQFLVRPYTLTELAELYYPVTPKVVRRWLRPFEDAIGKREGQYYTVKQVLVIFEKLGWPAEQNFAPLLKRKAP
jgi:hypothetical protein